MPLVPFYTRFRELAFQEMRTATLPQGYLGVPPGEYGFVELYCNEAGCDCRRVHLQVVTPPPNSRVLANINYGWGSEAFYRRWGAAPDPFTGAGPFLDPLNAQSEHAPALLRLFEEVVLADEAYIRRLARHYELFKGEIGTQEGNSRARRAARRRAQRGRGGG